MRALINFHLSLEQEEWPCHLVSHGPLLRGASPLKLKCTLRADAPNPEREVLRPPHSSLRVTFGC